MQIIWIGFFGSLGFILAQAHDKIATKMRYNQRNRRLDAGMYGHRFVMVAIGMISSMVWRALRGEYKVPLPFIEPTVTDSSAAMVIIFVGMILLWVCCLLLRGTAPTGITAVASLDIHNSTTRTTGSIGSAPDIPGQKLSRFRGYLSSIRHSQVKQVNIIGIFSWALSVWLLGGLAK